MGRLVHDAILQAAGGLRRTCGFSLFPHRLDLMGVGVAGGNTLTALPGPHLLEQAGSGGEVEPGLAGVGSEAPRAAGWPQKQVWIGECNMPLQDDTLREVWASDRSGRPLAAYLNPGDPDRGVGRSRNRGGRRIDAFASISGHEEEGGSPEVQRRPKQVCHPHLEMGQKGLPTVSRHKVGDLGGCGPPSAETGWGEFPGGFVFVFEERGICGYRMSRGGIWALGLWGIGCGHDAWEGSSFLTPRRRMQFPSR